MKCLILILTALSLLCGVYAHDEEPSTSLRGSETLESVSSASEGDPMNKIRCIAPTIRLRKMSLTQACLEQESDKTEPYTCDNGKQLCCNDSNLDHPNFKGTKFGQCHRGSSPHVYKKEDRKKSPDPMNRIECMSPNYNLLLNNRMSHVEACSSLDNSLQVPYSCDNGRRLCCTKSNIVNPNFKGKFGRCHQVRYPAN